MRFFSVGQNHPKARIAVPKTEDADGGLVSAAKKAIMPAL
jgi:hypothetical protein